MISLSAAQDQLLAMAQTLDQEDIPIRDACGRVIAQDIVALRNQPWADLSAMDGYAISAASLSLGQCRQSMSIAAGDGKPTSALGPGEAARIFTGAPLPDGADCVIIQEDVVVDGEMIRPITTDTPASGQNVRVKGRDFAQGQLLLSARTRMTPRHIGLAVAAGHSHLPCFRLPRVSLIATGNELSLPGDLRRPDSTPSSNSPMLHALIMSSLAAHVDDLGIIPDDLESMTTAFRRAAKQSDVIVTSGGASVGDHDHVRDALVAAGGHIDNWKIAMRPGKPVIIGKIGTATVVGLPGNPVSSYVTALMLLIPFLRRLAGMDGNVLPAPTQARLTMPMQANGPRMTFVRAIVSTHGEVSPLPDQDSAGLSMLAQANCLIIRDANAPSQDAGTVTAILMLQD